MEMQTDEELQALKQVQPLPFLCSSTAFCHWLSLRVHHRPLRTSTVQEVEDEVSRLWGALPGGVASEHGGKHSGLLGSTPLQVRATKGATRRLIRQV